jgi:hypothetical protein
VRSILLASIVIVLGFVVPAAPQSGATVSSGDTELFEKSIRPLFAKHCYSCHGPDQQLSSLRVDSREALIKGGKRGPSIVAGEPENSLLVKAIRHDELKMPMGSRLKDTEIQAVETWVRRNAPWPVVEQAKVSSRKERYAQLSNEHWAFQPLRKPIAPSLGIGQPGRSYVDRFILARLRDSGLEPAKPADKRTLIRRLSYVLTGLPPSAADADRFVADTSVDAYERLVDRTLASPNFGEHWARHWLDLVRFGETRGYEWNYEIIGAWRYRDYLIRAFNGDVPYDQLVREHIAGDLLDNPRLNAKEGINESVIGTAFYRLGEAGHDDCIMFREIALDVIDNEIDTLSKTFQGMTVSCARCHDHKLDPIPTEDYYGLYSILNSSRVVTHTIDVPDLNRDRIQRLKQLKQQIRVELGSIWKREAADISRYMLASLNLSAQDSPGGRDSNETRRDSWRNSLAFSGQKLEHPSYPWAALACRTASQQQYLSGEAAALALQYKRETAEREAFNRENFRAFGSFNGKVPEGWTASGNAVQNGFAEAGDFTLHTGGDHVLKTVLPGGFYSDLLSGRLNAALRSPDLPKDKKFLSVRVMGGNLGARRTVIDNCAIGENYKVFESNSPAWVRTETFAKEQNLPVFLELVTRSDNPRLPDRPDVLKPHQAKLLDDPRSFFGITEAVLHDGPDTPKVTLSHMSSLFASAVPSTWHQLADAYQARIQAAIERWSTGATTDDDVHWLSWLVESELLSNNVTSSPKLQQLVAEYRATEHEIPAPRVVEGLADTGQGRDYPVLVAGNSKTFGDPAPRRFLKNILGEAPLATTGSGRRELAEVIASPENPLTARVMVNRVWSYVFGRGIVASVDNFGVLGDKPSHPGLLDFLASDFVKQGWSVKKLIRTMVLSDTFRQSGTVTEKARELDPQNALLHHYPLRRLEAESIRDSILWSSGKLNRSIFGPSIHPHRDQPQDYRRLFSGPLDGDGRRSLYLKVTRMEGTRLLDTFDYPVPMTARGSRDVTNVPAQALTLLNDPFVLAEAEHAARRLLNQPATSLESRVEQLFLAALGRRPTAVETERFRGLAAELASLHEVPKDDVSNSLPVWKDLAHTVFNMKEFIYVQ